MSHFRQLLEERTSSVTFLLSLDLRFFSRLKLIDLDEAAAPIPPKGANCDGLADGAAALRIRHRHDPVRPAALAHRVALLARAACPRRALRLTPEDVRRTRRQLVPLLLRLAFRVFEARAVSY